MFLQIFGEFNDKIAFLTDTKFFTILKVINGLNNTGFEVVSSTEIMGIDSRVDKGISFNICSKSKYAFVHLYEASLTDNFASSVSVYEIFEEEKMNFLRILDIRQLGINWFAHNFHNFGYFGNDILIFGVEFGEKSKIQSFVFKSDSLDFEICEPLGGEIGLHWVERLELDGEKRRCCGLSHENLLIEVGFFNGEE